MSTESRQQRGKSKCSRERSSKESTTKFSEVKQKDLKLNVTIYRQIQLVIEKGIRDLILETVDTKLGNCWIRTSKWYGKSLSGIGRAKIW